MSITAARRPSAASNVSSVLATGALIGLTGVGLIVNIGLIAGLLGLAVVSKVWTAGRATRK